MSEQRSQQSYLVPALITMVIGLLSWMALNLNRISETLAVVVYKSDNHEHRLEFLENFNKWRNK